MMRFTAQVLATRFRRCSPRQDLTLWMKSETGEREYVKNVKHRAPPW